MVVTWLINHSWDEKISISEMIQQICKLLRLLTCFDNKIKPFFLVFYDHLVLDGGHCCLSLGSSRKLRSKYHLLTSFFFVQGETWLPLRKLYSSKQSPVRNKSHLLLILISASAHIICLEDKIDLRVCLYKSLRFFCYSIIFGYSYLPWGLISELKNQIRMAFQII